MDANRHKPDELPLSMRTWMCPGCGAIHDRDVNTATNLKNMAVSSTVSAYGEEGSDPGRRPRAKPTSVKQEVGFKFI